MGIHCWIGISLTLAASLFLVNAEFSVAPDGNLQVYVLDVGQGDSILVRGPMGETILIDGGPDMKALEQLDRHLSFFHRSIDLLVITHPDSDHITSLKEVLKRYDVKSILFGAQNHSSKLYAGLITEVMDQSVPIIIADPDTDIVFDSGMTLDVIHPSVDKPTSLEGNNMSVVFRLLYGTEAILFTGDIEKEAEDLILLSGRNIRSNVLKVAHHGSKTSSSTGFLLHTNPDTTLISAGGDRHRLGHPHREVVMRLQNFGSTVKQTNVSGTLMLTIEPHGVAGN